MSAPDSVRSDPSTRCVAPIGQPNGGGVSGQVWSQAQPGWAQFRVGTSRFSVVRTAPSSATAGRSPNAPGPVDLTQLLVTLTSMRPAQVLNHILRGEVANVDFVDLVKLVLALGFEEVGGRGSHRVFARAGVKELVNLQAERGQAKPYQVRQIAMVVRRYDLRLEDER